MDKEVYIRRVKRIVWMPNDTYLGIDIPPDITVHEEDGWEEGMKAQITVTVEKLQDG